MLRNEKGFKELGKFLLKVIKDFYPSSSVTSFNEFPLHNEPAWHIYSTLNITGHLRCEFRKWDYKPFFIVFFKSSDKILELDLTRVVEVNNKYSWYLSKPSNKTTLEIFSSNLEWVSKLPNDYVDIVREQKRNFNSGTKIGKGGYVLVRNADITELKKTFQNFTNELVISFYKNLKKEKTEEFNLDDVAAEEGYKEDKSYLTSKRNSGIVKKRKQLDNYTCQVCGFHLVINGKHIIECHHLNPIGTGEIRITNIEDLISLCPTCHRIAHLRKPAYKLNELKKIMNKL